MPINASERRLMQKEYKFLKNCHMADSIIRNKFNNRWGYDMTGEFFRELHDKLTSTPEILASIVDHYITPDPMLDPIIDYAIKPKRDHRGSTTRPIKPPPEHFIVQFIGGPINGEQHFKPYKEYFGLIKQGGRFTQALPADIKPMPISPGDPMPYLETANYKFTFIPQSETPFSDDQIVIAIFQPETS